MLTDSFRKDIQKEFKNLKNSSSLLRPLIESDSYGLALISSDFHILEVNLKRIAFFDDSVTIIDQNNNKIVSFRVIFGQLITFFD